MNVDNITVTKTPKSQRRKEQITWSAFSSFREWCNSRIKVQPQSHSGAGSGEVDLANMVVDQQVTSLDGDVG